MPGTRRVASGRGRVGMWARQGIGASVSWRAGHRGMSGEGRGMCGSIGVSGHWHVGACRASGAGAGGTSRVSGVGATGHGWARAIDTIVTSTSQQFKV